MATTSILNVYEPLGFQANATVFTVKINKERLVLLYTIMSSFNIAYHISWVKDCTGFKSAEVPSTRRQLKKKKKSSL